MREGDRVLLDPLMSAWNQEIDVDTLLGRILHPIPGSCKVKDPSREPLSVTSA